MSIVPRLSLARRPRVSNPAGKRIRVIVLFSAVAVASGFEIASASSGSLRGLLLRGLGVSGGRAVEALIPPVPNHNVATRAPAATLSDTQLNIARRAHTATRLTDGKVLIVGGENSDGFVTPAEIFDPATGTFAVSANLNTPRADHTATRLSSGQVLIAGGRCGLGSLSSTEIFDPTSRAFTNGPNLNSARSGQSATALSDGRIVFAGGDAAGSVEIYDPQANTFSAISAHMLTARAFHSAAALSLVVGDQQFEKILIVGGSAPDATPVKSGEIFGVASSTFSSVCNELTDEHISALLRVLPDGKVQIIGGTDHEDMEIYDPATNAFGAHVHVFPIGDIHPALLQEILDAPTRAAMFHLGASSALLNRSGQTITELPASNQALVAGGVDASGNNLSSASVLNSSSASVTTDKLDYPPGKPVIVSGAGWQPHEVVTLMFHEDPHVDTENPHTFSVQTDADGNFISQQYAPESQDAGVNYILAAKGGTSGRTAQTAFTDADTVGDYRSAASGNWNAAATWERFDGSNWVAAVASPTSADGVITIRSGHTVTLSASGLTYDQVVVDAGGQVTVAATITSTLANVTGTDLIINGAWLNQGGTWTTTGTWSVGPGGTFIQNSTTSGFGTNLDKATLDAASNFIYRGSSGNVPSSSFSGRNYGSLSFESTSGSYSISASGAGILNVSDFTIGSGVTYSTSQSGVMTFAGNFTNDGTLTNGAGTQIYTFTGSGKTISGSGAIGFETWNVNAGASITLGSNVSIALTFTGTISGTLNCGSNIVSGAGNFVLASGATLSIGDANGIASGVTTSGNIQVTSGTRTFDTGARYTYNGSANQAVGNGLPSTVANLTIANTGGGGNNTVTGNSGQTVTGLLWVQQGVYTGASIYKSVQIDSLGTLSLSGDATVGGNWINSGSFTHNNHAITFNGGTGQTIGGDTTFYDFNKSVSSPQTLLFGAGSTQTVTHALTLTGMSGNLLSLRSAVNGNQWSLHAPAIQNVDYIDVKDSNASGGTLVTARHSNDSGNNLNWFFCGANSPPTVNSFTSSPPGFIIDYINASTGDTLMLNATASDPDTACGDSVASFQWTINGHTTSTATNSLSIDWATLQSTYGIVASGTGITYPLSVKATDSFGAQSSATTGILTVYQNLVVPSLVVSAATCSQATSFDGSASRNNDPRIPIVSYAFDFGDGSPAYAETAGSFPDGVFDGKTTHTYAHAGLYNAILTVIDESAQSAQTTVPVNVTIEAPSINSQPVSVSEACPGSPVSFSVGATGTNLTYQWRRGGIPLSNGGNITGATSATLTINPVAIGDAGSYDVVVTGDCESSKTSLPATLSIDDIAPMFTTPPVDHAAFAGMSCEALVPDFTAGVVASDNCSVTLTQSPTVGTSLGLGHHMVRVTATDGANNSSFFDVFFDVTDNTPPSITAPPDVVVNANGSCAATGVGLGSPIVSDNCSGVGVPTNNAPSTFPLGDTTVTWSVMDAAGHTSTATQKVTVNDNANPVAVSKNVTVYLSSTAPGTVTVNATDINDGSTDNCSISQYRIKRAGASDATYGSSLTFGCGETGDQAVVLKVIDAAGNSSTASATVTVVDNTPPVAQSKSISRTFGLDGMVTVGPLDINNGSTENCAITEYKIKKAAAAGFADSVTFGCGDAGPQSVTLRVKDAAGNTHTSANTVTVNKRVTVLSYTGPVTAVYGSMVTLTVTLSDSATTTGIQGRTVVFTVGTQSVNATTDSSGVATAGLTLTQNIGNYTVQADFAGDCTFMSSGDSRLFAITPSCVTPIQQREYIGTLFAWTTSPTSSTATLTLGAGLKACTGDIRTARVSFAIRNGATWSLLPGATNVPVGPVDPGDSSQGTATAIVQYNIGSASAMDLEVAVIVTGNYAQNDPSQDALLTIAKPPAMSSITGGDETANLTDSRGFVRGANGDITQFFLNVTYNKKGSNPQGKVTVLVHSMNNPDGSPALSMRTYKIISTAISVLAADPNKGTASFSSKATLQDITDPLNPIAIDGGATLQLEVVDGDKGTAAHPAVGDTISIYLLNKNGGVWFVNKLDANLKAVQVPVISATGDIVVK